MSLYDLAAGLEAQAITHQQLTDTATHNDREAAEIGQLIQDHLELAGASETVREIVAQLTTQHRQHAYRAGYARGLQAVTGVTR